MDNSAIAADTAFVSSGVYQRNWTIHAPVLGENAWRPKHAGVAELYEVQCPNLGLNADCTANLYLAQTSA